MGRLRVGLARPAFRRKTRVEPWLLPRVPFPACPPGDDVTESVHVRASALFSSASLPQTFPWHFSLLGSYQGPCSPCPCAGCLCGCLEQRRLRRALMLW